MLKFVVCRSGSGHENNDMLIEFQETFEVKFDTFHIF